MKPIVRSIALLCALALAAAGGWYVWQGQQDDLPAYIAFANGRIEAEEAHVAAKDGGRVMEVLAREGEMVEAGQIVARMDTAEVEARLAALEAELARANEARAEAQAGVVKADADLRLAGQELARTESLIAKGYATRERLDQQRAQQDSGRASLQAARARVATAERSIEAAEANVRQIKAELAEAVVRSPRAGRVLYRLTEPGEVLAAGGKVVSILDLTDVHMIIFLPTGEVGRIGLGAEARIVLDAAPDYVIPGEVSFVSPEAQFTPKQVETRSEREKLMFRVKVRIPPDLLRRYEDQVKTGLPGTAYVVLGQGGPWPERLAVRLPPQG